MSQAGVHSRNLLYGGTQKTVWSECLRRYGRHSIPAAFLPVVVDGTFDAEGVYTMPLCEYNGP